MRIDEPAAIITAQDVIFERVAPGVKPYRLHPSYRQRLCGRVIARARNKAPNGTMTLRSGEGTWRQIAPGVALKLLRIDLAANNQTVCIRMSPGSRVDAHVHSLEEECYVIDGEISIGNHRLRRGDMHVAQRASKHACISSATGAVLLVRAEIQGQSAVR